MGNRQVNEFFISGKVVYVGDKIFYTDKISKRILVLEVYRGKYRNEVSYDFINNNMTMLDNIRKDDWVNVDFVITGRKNIQTNGVTRWFNNLEGVSCVKD